MANQPFDYTIINALERPTSNDLNQAQGQAHADVRLLARQLFQLPGSNLGQGGFVGDSFQVIPSFPNAMTVDIRRGIGFRESTAETNIGGIAGLSDAYDYKVLTIQDRTITVPPPNTPLSLRIDLIQVRELENAERLTNTQSKDIYNPSLNSFNSTSVYKTLTSDLTDVAVQTIAYTDTGTDPVVYKTGQSVFSSPTAPSVDPGYLAVAYIAVSGSTTAITSAEITDARNLLKTPYTVGGMIPAGTDKQIIMSDGSSWTAADRWNYSYKFQGSTSSIASSSYIHITDLDLTLTLWPGLSRIRLQPQPDAVESRLSCVNTNAYTGYAYIKVEVVGATSRTYVFKHAVGTQTEIALPYPAIEDYFDGGSYNIKVYGKVTNPNMTLTVENLVLFVGQ